MVPSYLINRSEEEGTPCVPSSLFVLLSSTEGTRVVLALFNRLLNGEKAVGRTFHI